MYERAGCSFSQLWEQGGQRAGPSVEGFTGAPQAVAQSRVQARQGLSCIPETVGASVAQASNAFAQIPQSLGGSAGGQFPQTVAQVASLQAQVVREFTEASAQAARDLVRS